MDSVATTWITACELAYGAANSQDPLHNQALVTTFLATLPMLDFNLLAAELFGRYKANSRRDGMTVADANLLIAALTMAQGATLVTGNIRHYARIPDLHLEDWIRQPSVPPSA